MNSYAAIISHPDQPADANGNVPLIQIFDSRTRRDNWLKDNADNPHVTAIDSNQAIRWLRHIYRAYRHQPIPAYMGTLGIRNRFAIPMLLPMLHTATSKNFTPDEVVERLADNGVLEKLGWTL